MALDVRYMRRARGSDRNNRLVPEDCGHHGHDGRGWQNAVRQEVMRGNAQTTLTMMADDLPIVRLPRRSLR